MPIRKRPVAAQESSLSISAAISYRGLEMALAGPAVALFFAKPPGQGRGLLGSGKQRAGELGVCNRLLVDSMWLLSSRVLG